MAILIIFTFHDRVLMIWLKIFFVPPPQVFFVIRLQKLEEQPTKIEDPDPIMACELMDGRDVFLNLSREKHWEFSSIRRVKFSSMAMLVELHSQGLEVYTCNVCKRHVETRWHCTICEVRMTVLELPIIFKNILLYITYCMKKVN